MTPRTSRRVVTAAAAAACLPLVVGACSKSNDAATTAPSSSTSTTAAAVNQGPTIVIGQGTELSFTPSQTDAKVGQAVTWRNDGAASHQVSQQGEPKLFESERMTNGQTFVFTPTQAGTFQYTCIIHPSMQGTLTVQP
jgi:plastocyanin